MTYRLTTRDGTAFFVQEADLEVVAGYLVSKGYPPINIEVADESSCELLTMVHSLDLA